MTTLENTWKHLKEGKAYALKSAIVKPTFLEADIDIDVTPDSEHCKIPIKKVVIPADHTIHMSHYLVHPLGHVEAVGEAIPKPISMGRMVEFVCFETLKAGKIKKGDLLGYFLAVPLKSEG
jgi:hypothetical protein